MAGSFDKPDANRAEIVRALREAGCCVELIRGRKGTPDLLVGFKGRNVLMEVKRPKGPRGGKGGELSTDQVLWHCTWRGQVAVVTTPEEALMAVGLRLAA